MIIEYNGKSVDTTLFTEVSEEERAQLEQEFYEKPEFDLVKKQILKVSTDGVMCDKINKYYFREIMAKTLVNKCKWTIEEVFKSTKVLGIFKAKTLTNKKVFPDTDSLITKIETAIRLGGISYAKLPTNFPIKAVRAILTQYGKLNDNYYDFSCGWGARLLGALSVHKNYYGTDPNFLLTGKLQELTKDYKEVTKTDLQVDIRTQGSEIFVPEWTNLMGIAFSSPPYFNLEDYQIGDQSYKPGVTYEDWKESYFFPTINNIYQYLIPGGFFCINIKNFDRYKIIEDCQSYAISLGFKLIAIDSLNNNHRETPTGRVNNDECIYIFQKPSVSSETDTVIPNSDNVQYNFTENDIDTRIKTLMSQEPSSDAPAEQVKIPSVKPIPIPSENTDNKIIEIYLFRVKSKQQLLHDSFWNTGINMKPLGEKYYAIYSSQILNILPQNAQISKFTEMTKDDINQLLLFCIYNPDYNHSFKNVYKLCEILENWEYLEQNEEHIFLLYDLY